MTASEFGPTPDLMPDLSILTAFGLAVSAAL